MRGSSRRRASACVGWRPTPVATEGADIGPTAAAAEPVIEQLVIEAADGCEGEAFERKVYMIRKRASNLLRRDESLAQRQMFYICSLSTKVIIYKGMLTTEQLYKYYPDLKDPTFESHLAMVHSRFATNTFPSWDRAQPLRFMSHNGEINTLRGNANWMFARQGVLQSELFGDDAEKLFPIVEPDCSDSGTFDNALEFLLMSGAALQGSVMMMVPEAWQNHATMSESKRAFYEYHSALMEPWDGPASIVFTDGKYIGAVLDRNGLRPSRYYLTHDDRVIMASEVGVVDVDPENVKAKGRLQPGKMFLVDFEQGRLIPDEELKEGLRRPRQPYGEWLAKQRIEPERSPHPNASRTASTPKTLLPRMQAFGYTVETMKFMLLPLVQGREGPDRLDGQRQLPGGAQRQAAAAVRLLQAALRAGHQPGDRLDPGRGDHVAGVLHRPRAEPARHAGEEHAHRLARAAPDPLERGARRRSGT